MRNFTRDWTATRRRVRFWAGAATLLAGACAPNAHADVVRNIQSKLLQPLAPRGGVMMIPLTADRSGDRWPQTLDVRCSDKRVLTGPVAWIEPAPEKADRHWTDDPRLLRIRAVQPADDSSAVESQGVYGPYLLLRVPDDFTGKLHLGKQQIEPQWRDVPGSPLPRGDEGDALRMTNDLPALGLNPSPDRPDPVSPFEYWRWVLLADRLEMNPPAPFGGEIERMTAEHYAALWRIGLGRLANQSVRIADQCREMLSKTCIDRLQPFAAWVADPAQNGLLLSRLLDPERTDTDVLSDAVTWMDEQLPLILWPESEFGDQVRITVVSPRAEPMIAQFSWAGSGEPPLAARIEPGVMMQITIDRPPLPAPAALGLPRPPERTPQVLLIEADKRQYQIAFGPRTIEARPPGVFFRQLMPPLTLAEAQMRQQRLTPAHQATLAHVRRLGGRWEVFVECRRGPVGGDAAALPEVVDTFDDLRGVEAITVLLGPEDALSPSSREIIAPVKSARAPTEFGSMEGDAGPSVWLTVPENGFWKIVHGTNDGTLQIHRKSFADRWNCRIVLPENWFSAQQAGPALIGLIRSHGESQQLETGPNLCTPWRAAPTRAALDLAHWDDLPAAE